MTLKKLLESQELKSAIEGFISKNKKVWDIGIYGSFVRGSTSSNDIDWIIILKETAGVNEKLELSQSLKSIINKIIQLKIDVKCVDINDFSDEDFLARSGIIAETFLFKHNCHLAEIFGFGSFYLFIYTLEGLTKSRKQMFMYALNGREKSKGLLELRNIEHIGKGILKVPLGYVEEIKEFFAKNDVKYKIKKIMVYS